VLCACAARAPVNEKQETEEILKSAFAAESPVYAPDEYAKAQESFYLANVAIDTLDFKKAHDLLEDSKREAQLAIFKSRASKAIQSAKVQLEGFDQSQLRKYLPDACAIAQKSLRKAESAYNSQKYILAKQKAELSLQLSKEFPKLLNKKLLEEKIKTPREVEKEKISKQAKEIISKAQKEAATIIADAKREARAIRARALEKMFPSSCTVRKGDTLRIIAGRREIYNDPYQWPLIYKANRDQIRDPQQIFVGQHLVIPRTITIEEVRNARQQAGALAPYDPPPGAFHPSDYK
jgi:nucleoid-associated protein YgaU